MEAQPGVKPLETAERPVHIAGKISAKNAGRRTSIVQGARRRHWGKMDAS
jgi:hypothetical protein